MTRWRLRRDVRIAVDYDDQTYFGSPVSERPEAATMKIYAPLVEYVQQHGFDNLLEAAPKILADLVASNDWRNVAKPDGTGGWEIKPEILYPDVTLARPQTITFEREDTGGRVKANLPADYWARVHALTAALSGAGQDDHDPSLHPDMRSLLSGLQRQDLLEDAELAPAKPSPEGAELTFLGHNTVVVSSGTARVMVDPYMFPGGREYLADYQPLQVRDLGKTDALLITHSHPDHFDPATLLQFPLDTKLIVPPVERETILASDIAYRARELGFTDVVVLPWRSSIQVGDIEVHALPFYGEQPTEAEMLHPEIRNVGSTYLVRTPTLSAVFLADSGRDGLGNVKDVASETRARLGTVDVVFSGYRGWLLYPPQYLFSSVARFLLFVPPWLWTVRQQIMTDAQMAVDIAERWGAKYVAAYADGGAPWHWNIGLGPRLDQEARELNLFDPFPERLADAALYRAETPAGKALASSVKPIILRPGDSMCSVTGAATIKRVPGHAWPYAERLEIAAQ
jgi:L-ascorbate metabolism protein UlaG (beta-lactamase superfamily)